MTELQICKRAEMHTPYIICACVHTAVTGSTAVTCRGNSGSHHCHIQGSQVTQLLHAEVTGDHTAVTYRGHRKLHTFYMERSVGSHRGRKIIQ